MKRVFDGEPDALLKVPKNKRGPLAAAVTLRLGHLFSRWLERNVVTGLGSSAPQLMLVVLLARHKTLTMGEAAELLDVTPRAITRLVDSLEKEELVSRQASPHDKRVYLISVTAKAEQMAKTMMPEHEKKMAQLFAVFTDEELMEYIRLNSKLASALKSELANNS
jgi:DNA-binding MarR family transcriptional regulator